MKTLNKILFLCGILVFMAFSCEKKNDDTPPLIGSWKCLGFGNTQTGTFKEIEPQNCEECYILNFKENDTVTGHTSTNQVMGIYEIAPSLKQLSFTRFGGTEINELFDGKKYVEAILKVHSYEINEQGDLLLFYDNNYLIYKSV